MPNKKPEYSFTEGQGPASRVLSAYDNNETSLKGDLPAVVEVREL